MLYFVILTPLLTAISILCIRDDRFGYKRRKVKLLSFYSAIFSFLLALLNYYLFNPMTTYRQYGWGTNFDPKNTSQTHFFFKEDYATVFPTLFNEENSGSLKWSMGMSDSSVVEHNFFFSAQFLDWFSFGIDGISLCFIILTSFITVFCVLYVWRRGKGSSDFLALLFLIQFFSIVVFTTLDIFVFYMFFESVLMPMFIMIGVWGSNYQGRVKASYYFFLYTLLGSTLMLLAIILMTIEVGSTSLVALSGYGFSFKKQLILWLFTFVGFAVKIPMLPIHIWLPEAHVEAPTEGSVILASLLLKLGGYGFFRVSLPMFPYGSHYFSSIVSVCAVLGVVYGSLTTLRQIDLKKIIAYSSVAHMNLVVLGIFSGSHYGLQGAMFLMIAHGVVSGALFFLVGMLYDRHNTRSIEYYGGLAQVMPFYAFFLLFFLLANMSFPGTCNFPGELLLLIGIMHKNVLIFFMSSTGIVLSAAYSIWVYNRVCFSNIKTHYICKYRDLNRMESYMMAIFTVVTLGLGIFPGAVTSVCLQSFYPLLDCWTSQIGGM